MYIKFCNFLTNYLSLTSDKSFSRYNSHTYIIIHWCDINLLIYWPT